MKKVVLSIKEREALGILAVLLDDNIPKERADVIVVLNDYLNNFNHFFKDETPILANLYKKLFGREHPKYTRAKKAIAAFHGS